MNFVYYFENKEIESALVRFLNYVLKIVIINKERKQSLKSVIFIDENFNINDKFLVSLSNYYNPHIIVFGYINTSFNNYINILDFSNLKRNLQRALYDTGSNSLPLLYVKEIGSKINLFFKGHGEASLFSSLNWTIYYLSNGPVLFKENKLSWEEYTDVYLKPGLKYWYIFIKRFETYNIYLKVTGFKQEVELVKELADNFQVFSDTLKNSTEAKIKETNEEEIKKNIDYLKQIDYIFTNIDNKIKKVSLV